MQKKRGKLRNKYDQHKKEENIYIDEFLGELERSNLRRIGGMSDRSTLVGGGGHHGHHRRVGSAIQIYPKVPTINQQLLLNHSFFNSVQLTQRPKTFRSSLPPDNTIRNISHTQDNRFKHTFGEQ